MANNSVLSGSIVFLCKRSEGIKKILLGRNKFAKFSQEIAKLDKKMEFDKIRKDFREDLTTIIANY